MTLKDLIESKDDLKKMQSNGSTYKEYLKAVLNKFNKKTVMQLSDSEKKYLDAGWKAKDE